jgi:predicted site-specific integrase-resolvase
MIKLQDMANRLGVSIKTLQRWDREGILVAKRTPTNRRYYTEDQYLSYVGKSQPKGLILAYTRVSSRGQIDDLISQTEFLKQFVNAKGEILDEVISDIGSGLNYNRKNWNKLLLDYVAKGLVSKIYITYKDRFVRFGFDWFERFCNYYNCKIVVVKNETTSPQQELVDDLISIIHVFSCRIYGLRKYKKELKDDESVQDRNRPNSKSN